MMKAVKKLKFWSRKKKKKKKTTTHILHYPPSISHCCCSYSSTQPSAPPLPPWLNVDQTHNAIFVAEVQPGSGFACSSEAQFPPQDIVLETSPLYSNSVAETGSYQQYMVENPIYGVPVVPTVRRERSAGVFGCVVEIGIYLIRCFCPCFRIREVH